MQKNKKKNPNSYQQVVSIKDIFVNIDKVFLVSFDVLVNPNTILEFITLKFMANKPIHLLV